MATWLERMERHLPPPHQLQLAVTAVVSGATVAAAIFGVQSLRRRIAMEELKESIPTLEEDGGGETFPDFSHAPLAPPKPSKEDERATLLARRAQAGDYDDDLIAEQLTRTSAFLTPAGLARLRNSFVVVVGLGGVGSHCAAQLARSGVSRLRVVDFDQVTLSSLNRHAVATLADVGTPKVVTVRRRLEAVAPWVAWECCNEIWRAEEAERLLGPWRGGKGGGGSGDGDGGPDFVVDAIDNIDSKVALLRCCYERKLKVISSTGAACKADPTRVRVGDISTSSEDPLCKATRRRLRLAGIKSGIPCVYSTEKPGEGKAELLPLSDEEFKAGNVGELAPLPDFRARILPVIGTMPAIFGCVVANHVIMELAGYPYEYAGGMAGAGSGVARAKVVDFALAGLQASEERIARKEGANADSIRIPISKDDAGFLLEEVYRGKSILSGLTSRLILVRWRAPPPLSEGESGFPSVDESVPGQKLARLRLGDLVCMTREEAVEHEKKVVLAGKKPEDVYGKEVLEAVDKRLKDCMACERYR